MKGDIQSESVSLTSNKIKLTMSRAVIIPNMESSIRMKSEPKNC